jgi:LuxR family quorum sensing-dependent transcriptional regulator
MQPRGIRNSLDHTLEFIRNLDRARNLGDVSAQVLRHVAPFGAEHVLCGTMPEAGESCRQQLGHVLLNEWPSEWAHRYFSKGYLFCDQTIRLVKAGAAPFFWDELVPGLREDLPAQRVMNEAAEFHLKEGFTASLLTLDGQRVGFSVAGRHLAIEPNARAMLTLIASYAIGRAIALKQSSPADTLVALSAREREALQWASEGKNDWEIGEIMNISEHGADKHMRSARVKLGAINRTQAVAEAIRRGLIA